jgi:hypothetical protein
LIFLSPTLSLNTLSTYNPTIIFALLTISRVLPATTTPQSVHLLGSWDNFHTPIAMEQDIRVGRGVWKYMITDKGGLEMGSEFTYYVSLSSERIFLDGSINYLIVSAGSKALHFRPRLTTGIYNR